MPAKATWLHFFTPELQDILKKSIREIGDPLRGYRLSPEDQDCKKPTELPDEP